jgi:hypothetical protein
MENSMEEDLWGDHGLDRRTIKNNFLLLLNIREWRRLAEDRNIWWRTNEEVRTRCGLSRH